MMVVSPSSMRKSSNSEKTESSSALFKRGEYSQTSERCSVSTLPVDENIPDNMQKEINDHFTETKTLATTIPIKQSCNDFDSKDQKPIRKKRLNLKKVKAGSQVKSIKDPNNSEEETKSNLKYRIQLALENRSTVIGDECANKMDHNEDIMKLESNDGEFKCPDSCAMQSCPVCRGDMSNLHVESDNEWNEHVNNCLDSVKTASTSSKETSAAIKELEFCQICQRDMSRYNSIQRQQHVNRCCDSIEITQSHLPVPSVAQKQLSCLICGKLCKTFKSRQSHMKKCAKENNVSTVQLVKLNRNENTEDQTDNCFNKDSRPDSSKVKVESLQTKEKKQKIFKSSKRKRDTKFQNKDLDEQTQLALALSASLHSNAKDKGPLVKRARKKREGQTTLPALLLRSDDETKKVTEARAAAVLCHWADSDDEIQCTPALAPSTLLQKYASESDTYSLDGTDQVETSSDNLEPDNGDQKEIAGKDESVDTDVCMSNQLEREDNDVLQEDESLEKEQKIEIFNETPLVTTVSDNDSKKSLTVNTQSRLWRIASLCTGNLSESGFYVPNLLPKTTPRKEKVVNIKSGLEAIEGQEECYAAVSDDKNTKQDSPFKATTQKDGITESQEKDIELLAELVGEERSDDMQSNIDEEEMNGELEKTWFPSSGFCVRKDNHGQQNEKNERIDTLLNDLTCMVGNPLLSDVEIIGKDSQKLYAHSFMLATRCKTLATMLYQEKLASNEEDDRNNNFIPLKMVDIDVRAVHAVMTYIYTASFVPVQPCVMEDVKTLIGRLNLDCAVDEWEEMNENEEVLSDCNDGLQEDDTEHEEPHGNLDVLLKSLWAGEDETENNPEEEDNAFGDSVLDDELDDMEIKIYTQVTPTKGSDSAEERSDTKLHNNKGSKHVDERNFIDKYVVELDSDSDESVAAKSTSHDLAVEKSMIAQNNDSVYDHQQQTNVGNSLLPDHLFSPTSSVENSVESIENKDGDIPVDSDSWFISDTPPESLSDLTSLARSHRSRMEYDNEVQTIEDDTLPGDLTKPKKPIIPPKDQEETQRYYLLDSYSPTSRLTSKHNSSPKASYINSSLNKGETSNVIDNLSPTSPEEITVFPASRNQSFLAQHHDNSIMGPQDSVVPKSQKSNDFENSELETVSSPVLETTQNTKKSICESSMNADSWLDGSISSSMLRVISTPERHASHIENDLNDDDDVRYDNQDFDCYDDGGFNCDIEDYFSTDTPTEFDADVQQCASEREDEEEKIKQVQPVQENPKSCKTQMKDHLEKGIVCKRSRTTNNKRQQLEAHASHIENDLKDDDGVCYDNQDFDCYDDGGFNCDIEDYFNADTPTEFDADVQRCTSEREDEDAVVEQVQPVQEKPKSCKTQMKDHLEKGIICKRSRTTNNKRRQLEDQNSKTPMLDYSNMDTPDLTTKLKQYGVRPLPKRKMVIKLKEIYHYTHQDTSSEDETDNEQDQRQAIVEIEQRNREKPKKYMTEENNSVEGSTQDSGESSNESSGTGSYFDEELSQEVDVLSQESSINLSKQLMSFITQNPDLYLKVLKYEPISLATLQGLLKDNGIKCPINELKDFLDEQCITFSVPRAARARKRQRRAKPKARKNN